MSKIAFGVDAGAISSLGPATGGSGSVLPFTVLRLSKPPPWCLLPVPAGRGADNGVQ